jgi:hypothetical protein
MSKSQNKFSNVKLGNNWISADNLAKNQLIEEIKNLNE